MIPFSKYVGCGNDFILIDRRTSDFYPDPQAIQTLCDRHYGIGADGLLLLDSSVDADWKMSIFNADGNEAQMCGNGIRCLGRFLQHLGEQRKKVAIETRARTIWIEIEPEFVTVFMGEPLSIEWDKPLHLSGNTLTVHLIDTGAPHAVLLVDDVGQVDIATLGRQIRNFPGLDVNATFASIEGDIITVRTFERGVEGETLACGTGASAAALAFARKTGQQKYAVKTRSGKILHISCSPLKMSGEARYLFNGQFPVQSLKIKSL